MHQQLTDSSGAIYTKYLGSHTEPLASIFGPSELWLPFTPRLTWVSLMFIKTYWMKPAGIDRMHELTQAWSSIQIHDGTKRIATYTDEHQQLQYHHPNEFLVPLLLQC